eukprot:4444107-Pyramimonas_sp.AAC.1
MRNFKPTEWVWSAAKAKFRWCVHGHQNHDAESLSVYALAPQSESIMLVCQIIASMGWALNVADAMNAFFQSNRLRWPAGATNVETCLWLELKPGQLMDLVAPVYGLNDAPLLWHPTLTEYLGSLGFVKS